MIEATLLKVMSIKENYNKYYNRLAQFTKILSRDSLFFLKEYKKYFEARGDIKSIDFDDFSTFLLIESNPNLDDKKAEYYKNAVALIKEQSLEDASCISVIKAFEQQEFYAELGRDLDKNLGLEELKQKIVTFYEKVSQSSVSSLKLLGEDFDFDRVSSTVDRTNGLLWRLNSLNNHFGGGIRKGDFIIVAGPSDSGKTSLVASELSYMAQQLEEEDYILWLNTEGEANMVRSRLACAVCNCIDKDLIENKERVETLFKEKLKGNINRIRVLDAHRFTTHEVEEIVKKHPPRVIIFDLLDHIGGFNSLIGKEGKGHEWYAALYQWARTIATEICPVFAISQVSGDAYNELYPDMTMLAGSRVGKQSAATAIIFIGLVQGNDSQRYLSIPKNKIGGGKSFRKQIYFDAVRSRFRD